MPKLTTVFVCAQCDAQSPKWIGRCPNCQKWGSLHEETLEPQSAPLIPQLTRAVEKPRSFVEILSVPFELRLTGLDAIDRVLGGGLVPGSVTLLGGEPGIGKSTLVTQLAITLAQSSTDVLCVAAEESPEQIARRVSRCTSSIPPLLTCVSDTRAEAVAGLMTTHAYALVIVDSLQMMSSEQASGEAGSVSQMRAVSSILTEAAKRTKTPLFLIGQVTKEGDLAGPKTVEHIVDTVLFFEGERTHDLRVLRITKHRFGSTDPVILMRMTEHGCECIQDPSAFALAHRPLNVAGSSVGICMLGQRPACVEIQSLVVPMNYGSPARRVSGIDPNRLALLIAVLSRRCALSFGDHDVFVNVVGGFDARDPSMDLTIALSLASAKTGVPLPQDLACMGEVGLAGELRPVSGIDARVREAKRNGFSQILCAESKDSSQLTSPSMHGCRTLTEALNTHGIKSQK